MYNSVTQAAQLYLSNTFKSCGNISLMNACCFTTYVLNLCLTDLWQNFGWRLWKKSIWNKY